MTEIEREDITKAIESECSCTVGSDSIPLRITIRRGYRFDNSDYKERLNYVYCPLSIKEKGKRKFRDTSSEDRAWKVFARRLNELMPQIVYFPTFLFTQPQRIYLFKPDERKEEDPVNRLYREIIENVAASLPHPLDTQRHIVERIVNEDTISQKILGMMLLSSDKQEQVNAALSELSSHLTDTVFDRWSKIFGGDFSGREISLRPGVEQKNGSNVVYVEIYLKDGSYSYGITERSLGFRWFFSFLLFTLYRVSAKNAATTLFLLDEPASNLHSRAQMQLVDSLSRIATGNNQIMYSTHSHYMINPEWLDQAFIISNSAVDYSDFITSGSTPKARNTDIKASRYRDFVGQNPDKMTYFQPVMDKLDVAPSKIDLVSKSVIVEGKGDYLILQYGLSIVLGKETSFKIVPTKGAAGMDEIIGLFLGWAVPFVICLDDDKEGRAAAKRYREDWALPISQVITLGDIADDLKGKSIEGFLEVADVALVDAHFSTGGKSSKSQKQLYFSEMLAKRSLLPISDAYKKRITAFEKKILESF